MSRVPDVLVLGVSSIFLRDKEFRNLELLDGKNCYSFPA
jgi:hypothetical protein